MNVTSEKENNRNENLLSDTEIAEVSKNDVKSNEVLKMGEAPIGRLLAEMSWPAILSMLINALYNLVDSIFVGMVNQNALTAVSLIMPIQLFMIATHVGSGVGVNSLIARRLGAKRYDEADQAASTSLRIAVLNFVIYLTVGIFLTKPFVGIYTNDPQIYHYGVSYMTIICCFCLFNAIDLQIEKVLQATGNMISPMLISMSGAVTNIVLDPIFIFGLFGVPRLEVTGAAIATVCGQFVAMTVALITLFRKKHDVTVRIRGFKLDWKVVRDIYSVGLPSIIMASIGSVMLIGYNKILAASTAAVAVLGVYFKLQSFFFMPVFGLNQGAMPIMGYNYGARKKERLIRTFMLAFLAAFIIMCTGCLIFHLIPDELLKMFSADKEMMRIGIPALKIISICFLPASFGIIASTLFQATGHGLYSMFATFIRQLIGILPIAYVLYHWKGVTVSWYSFPLAEILGTAYIIVMLRHLYIKEIKDL